MAPDKKLLLTQEKANYRQDCLTQGRKVRNLINRAGCIVLSSDKATNPDLIVIGYHEILIKLPAVTSIILCLKLQVMIHLRNFQIRNRDSELHIS